MTKGHVGYVLIGRQLHSLRSYLLTCDMKQLPTRNLRGSAKGGLIEHCGQCGAKVALIRPAATLDASPWRCRGCRSIFLATLERRAGSLFRGGVTAASYSDVFQPIEMYRSPRRAVLSDDDVQQLKRCTPPRSDGAADLRQTGRHAVVAPVSVLPLEEDFRISGVPATAYTIDVSCGGLSLLHPEPTIAPYFAVEFSLASAQIPPVLFRPKRCARLGSAYSVAGEFVCRLNY